MVKEWRIDDLIMLTCWLVSKANTDLDIKGFQLKNFNKFQTIYVNSELLITRYLEESINLDVSKKNIVIYLRVSEYFKESFSGWFINVRLTWTLSSYLHFTRVELETYWLMWYLLDEMNDIMTSN